MILVVYLTNHEHVKNINKNTIIISIQKQSTVWNENKCSLVIGHYKN